MPKENYPSEFEKSAVLKDGSRIFLRPIREDNTGRWLDFMSRLAPYTKYLRFHSVPKMTQEDAVRYCTVDYHNSFALVAEIIKEGRKEIVAVARYQRLPREDSAEVAFLVEESFQNKGIGTKLLEQLTTAAKKNGISTFEADVLAENEETIKVFTDYGFHVKRDFHGGEWRITFSITPAPEAALLRG
ncbi:MAG: N-acetyltransferase family protein [Thermodesulfobacteriota bacterium]